MKLMRRFTAVLMSTVLAVTMLAGCGGKDEGQSSAETPSTKESAENSVAEGTTESSASEETPDTPEEKTYDEFITFTATTNFSEDRAGMGYDYRAGAIYKHLAEKFNFDMEVWDCPSKEKDNKQRIWINTGTMPDTMRWGGLNLVEYLDYVNQGLLKPLPDDWKTKWPELARTVKASGIEEIYTIDGKLYILPTATYANFFEPEGKLPKTESLFFRKDWAKQVGMEKMGEDGIVTHSELKEYLQKVKDAGLCDKGLGTTTAEMQEVFFLSMGVNTSNFYDAEDGSIAYGPGQPEVIDAIKEMQDWYNTGLLDEDYYSIDDSATYRSMFGADLLAAYYKNGSAGNTAGVVEAFQNNGTEDPLGDDILGYACLATDDRHVYSRGGTNYSGVVVFNPETDDKTMERILDIIQYFTSKEGQISRKSGVYGESWTYDDDGGLKILIPEDEYDAKAVNEEGRVFQGWAIAEADIGISGYASNYDPQIPPLVQQTLELRKNGTIFMDSDRYTYLNSDVRANYSVPVTSKIAEIVCNKMDAESEWSKFLEEYKGIWQPVLDELNGN